MDRARLSAELAHRTGLSPADAGRATDMIFVIIGEQLASGRSVELDGFGRFRARGLGKRALRYARPAISLLGGGAGPRLVLRGRRCRGASGALPERLAEDDPATEP